MITILYVDDEEALLDITKIYLERTGNFTVKTAVSAKDGLDLLKTDTFDAVVSDYQMPGMDGIAFLRALRVEYPTLPFIIFTGRGREDVVISAFEAGADFYLQKGGAPKPQFAELAGKITSAVQQRKSAAREFTLNRLYSVLSATNHAIIHRRGVKELLDEICRIAIDIGGFRMAWAGRVNERTRMIDAVASCGVIDGYLDTMEVSSEDIPVGRGPTGTAYRTGQHSVVNDLASNAMMNPWREEALKRGYQSIAAFPFAMNTRNAGTLTLYAPLPGFFDEDIVKLLDEMTGDITFALKSLEDEENRKKAEENLKRNAEKFRSIFDAAPVLICSISRTGLIVDCNRRVSDIFGYDKKEIVGKSIDTIVHPDELDGAIHSLKETLQTGAFSVVNVRMIRKDRAAITVRVNASAIRDRQGEFFRAIWIIEDISEQLRLKEELCERNETLAAANRELNEARRKTGDDNRPGT